MSRDHLKIMEQVKAVDAAEQSQEQAQPQSAELAPALNARQSAVLRMQQTAGNAAVQRALVQRATDPYGMEGGPIDDQTTSAINGARGGGQSLDSGVAQRMSGALGSDFSGVKVHTDDKANDLNSTLNARAFTTGSDIFFQKGAYNPGTSDGDKLISHELTHVAQQGGSYSGGSLELGPAGDSYEQEAESTSSAVNSGAAAPAAQREMDDDKDMLQASRVQRVAEDDEKDLLQASRVQRDAVDDDDMEKMQG